MVSISVLVGMGEHLQPWCRSALPKQKSEGNWLNLLRRFVRRSIAMSDPRRNDIGVPNVECLSETRGRQGVTSTAKSATADWSQPQNPLWITSARNTRHTHAHKWKYTKQTDSSKPRSRSHLHFGSSRHLCAARRRAALSNSSKPPTSRHRFAVEPPAAVPSLSVPIIRTTIWP